MKGPRAPFPDEFASVSEAVSDRLVRARKAGWRILIIEDSSNDIQVFRRFFTTRGGRESRDFEFAQLRHGCGVDVDSVVERIKAPPLYGVLSLTWLCVVKRSRSSEH